MIVSPDNPSIKAVRELHNRRGRQEQGAYLAEGVRLVEEALAAGQELQATYVVPSDLSATSRGAYLLATLRARPRPPVEVTPRVMAALAGTVTPQGVVSVIAFPSPPALPKDERLLMVLDGIQDPGNLGTIMRTAAAAGVGAVIAAGACTDPFSPKAVRAGMGAHFRVPILTGLDWPQITCLLAGCQVWVSVPTGGQRYDTVDWGRQPALIVGGEAQGAGTESMAMATGLMSIPLRNDVESLNASAAAAVLLFEWRRVSQIPAHLPGRDDCAGRRNMV